MNSERYCEKIVPLIAVMIPLNPWLSVMQDNAPAHSSAETNEEMRVRQVLEFQTLSGCRLVADYSFQFPDTIKQLPNPCFSFKYQIFQISDTM